MMIVDLILLKNRNFARTNIILLNHRNVLLCLLFLLLINKKLSRTCYFGRIFRVPEVCVSYRLLQTVLFLTDSVFVALFACFNESMIVSGGISHGEVRTHLVICNNKILMGLQKYLKFMIVLLY